jgi:hypothetical protein
VKSCSLVVCLCLALSAALFAQETLSNTSIEKMARARLGDDVIVSMIQSQAGHYDVTPDSFIALKREGISDRVLAAMAAKGGAVAPAPAPIVADSYEDFDIGVYRRARNTWIPVAAEPVNWKTGGVLKSIATDGIVKGDVNGRLQGGGSATQLNTPLEFLIRTPDGVDAADFQLVHLHEKSDAREFRTMTGGVFHRSGGASRDAVTFAQTRIAKHTYNQVRMQCRANGLWGSLSMNSQQAASDWLNTLYQASDAAPVYMGFKLYSFPYSEVSAVGNGVIYNAPTATGPVANLSTENGDFLASNANPIE